MIASTCGILSELGATDCETLGDGWLAQPVNALSSLTYALIGLAIAVSTLRSDGRRAARLVFATCLIGVGLGSVAFHGPQLSGSQLMHDLPILLTVLFMLDHDRKILWPASRRGLIPYAGASAVAVLLAATVPLAVAPLSIAVASAVVVAEVVISRRHLRPVSRDRQRRSSTTIVVIAIAGGAAWVLGRSNSPLCEPDAWYQLHGLWHLLSAIVFAVWYWWALADDRDWTT